MKRTPYHTAVLVFLASLVGGCATPYDGYYSKLIAAGQFGTAPERLREQAVALARQRYRSVEKQDAFVYSYYDGYESGLKCIHGTYGYGNGRGPHSLGVKAGRAAAIADLEAGTSMVTLGSFGYAETEKEGRLTFEFENQEFLPEDSAARWWVVYNPDVAKRYAEVLGYQARRFPPVFAHLRGYLSPDRIVGVGHFNQYDHAFVVTQIIEMKRVEWPVGTYFWPLYPARPKAHVMPSGNYGRRHPITEPRESTE